MKILNLLLLVILILVLVACNQSPTSPILDDNLYQVNVVADGVLGWTLTVEYPGQPESYNGSYNVGVQDHNVDWRSPYNDSTMARLTLYDSIQAVIAVFTVNNKQAMREGSTWTGAGWVKDGDHYYAQLDCR